MSVGEQEIEEPPDAHHCTIHQLAYLGYCGACLADEADRRHDSQTNKGEAR